MAPKGLEQQLHALRPAIVKAAQKVLDGWEQDDEGIDEEFGAGGVCDAIDTAIADVVFAKIPNVNRTQYGHDGDDHASSIYYDDKEAFLVDIGPHVYESGGGYRWKKRAGVRLDPHDVEIVELKRSDIVEAGMARGRCRRGHAEPERVRLYHGSRTRGLRDLHASRGGEYGPGVYLTSNPDTARMYARSVAQGPDAPVVYVVEAVVNKPFETTKQAWLKKTESRSRGSVQRSLILRGHDAISAVGLSGSEHQVVVFDPARVRIVGVLPDAGAALSQERFPVPKSVQRAAREGLQLLAEGFGGRGLTEGAISRARSLARGTPIRFDRARMMRAWFSRHKVDKRPRWEQDRTPGWVAWQLWGGDAAWKWVEAIVRGSK